MAISNQSLRALENGCVSFEWKDYAQHGQRKHDLGCGGWLFAKLLRQPIPTTLPIPTSKIAGLVRSASSGG
ncbi:MAG TPA: hypothetical protein VEV17_01880 [Bryobacteraceae bacterium]|nr:hypothetical protein [Bryobacteraceae bacterium]